MVMNLDVLSRETEKTSRYWNLPTCQTMKRGLPRVWLANTRCAWKSSCTKKKRHPPPPEDQSFALSACGHLLLLILVELYSVMRMASLMWPSVGQYGHLHREPLAMFLRLSLQMTWPQGSSMGGLISVVCSLLTGQTKMGW